MKVWTILAITIMSIFLIGCSRPASESNSMANENNQDASTFDIQVENTEEAGTNQEDEEAEAPANVPESTTSDNTISKEFEDLLAAKGTLEFKVEYNLKTTADGKTMNSKMSQYIKGVDKLRSDITVDGMETRTYFVDNALTSCSKSDGKWTCYKFEASDEEESQDVSAIEEGFKEEPGQFDIQKDGTMTVAGTSTTCYKITSKEDQAIVKYCFSKDAIPLYIKMEGDEFMNEMSATTYSTKVSDSDFTPPAKAEEMGSISGSSGGDSCSGCNYLSGEQKEYCLQNC